MKWSRVFASVASSKPRKRSQRNGRRARVLRKLEALEDRRLLAATTFDVTNTDSSGAGSLAKAVEEANLNPGGDTIRLAPNVRGEIALGDELMITDDLTIRGPGADKLTVSGEGEHRVFSVQSADLQSPIDVEINRLTLANGLATDAPGFPPETGFMFGGGLYNLGSNVALSSVRMIGNRAGNDPSVGPPASIAAGGAIANEFGGSLTVRHSEFGDNLATGGIIAVGGGISSDIGPTVTEEGEPGEGTGKPEVRVAHSSFRANQTQALASDPSAAGDFAPFAGYALGGGLASFAGDATVSHTEFVENAVVGGAGGGGTEGGFAGGGAIFVDDFSPFDAVGIPGRDAHLELSHSRFIGNAATGGQGDGGAAGGLAAGGAVTASHAFFPDTGSVRHSIFQDNTATGGTGGAGGAGGPAIGGGLAVLGGAEVSVEHSYFGGNRAAGGAGDGNGNGGDAGGGAIGLGRADTAVPTPFESRLPSIVVQHTSLISNAAEGGTGGDLGGDGGSGNGGGLGVMAGAEASVSHALIFANRAIGGDGGGSGDGGNGQGGGVSNSGATTSLARSVVFRNFAEAGEGGDAGGTDGLGLGGGLFNEDDLLGTLSADRLTRLLTRFNRADDAGDNTFGALS